MSQKLINRSPDLQKLQAEGYEVTIIGGTFLLISSVPYLNAQGEIMLGTLVSKLTLAGDKTAPVDDHVAYFIGTQPHNEDGSVIQAIYHSAEAVQLHEHLKADLTFSNKPKDRMYVDYYEKMTSYISHISSQAQLKNPDITAKTFKPIIAKDDPESVFNYYDTNSSRAEIGILSKNFEGQIIAIIGLGGTGSYVLDQVAKTPVNEIHLFDADLFLQHNAFRGPGAPSIEELELIPKKVHHLSGIYSKMHKYISPHDFNITEENLDVLNGMTFVFICIDKGAIKKKIINHLVGKSIPFIDVGIGVDLIDDKLRGSVRTTLYTDGDPDYLRNWISFSDTGNDEYDQNIQIAELNSLNAALAIIKWKKFLAFYHDLIKEKNSSYDIDVNTLFNNETIT